MATDSLTSVSSGVLNMVFDTLSSGIDRVATSTSLNGIVNFSGDEAFTGSQVKDLVKLGGQSMLYQTYDSTGNIPGMNTSYSTTATSMLTGWALSHALDSYSGISGSSGFDLSA